MTALNPTSHVASGPSGASILLVEDDPILRLSLAMELGQAGFRVREAADAAEAQALLEGGTPVDLVITDIEMPGREDGLALARAVRARAPDIRVIVVSGTLPEHGVVGVADAYFGKPYDPARLIAKARALLAAGTRRIIPRGGNG
jgi:DNA-binding response OmpR family regulator